MLQRFYYRFLLTSWLQHPNLNLLFKRNLYFINVPMFLVIAKKIYLNIYWQRDLQTKSIQKLYFLKRLANFHRNATYSCAMLRSQNNLHSNHPIVRLFSYTHSFLYLRLLKTKFKKMNINTRCNSSVQRISRLWRFFQFLADVFLIHAF